MRFVNYKDLVTSEIKQIRATTNKLISNLEILLPLDYMIMYSGFESWFADRTSMDFDDESIKKCNNKIFIINNNPKVIDYVVLAYLTEEETIERYKYIIANCRMITIFLNEDKTLSDLEVSYLTNSGIEVFGHPNVEWVYLFGEEDKFDSSVINIAREHY